ncbi:hypothetical protein I79_021552 [Cricetulus griseus]|uniref:Secreted protein n=1 Tax=Cricetulus griseus TaxID=10029 RepID=G3ICZ1_CRIGR|nr:hypothetical protein I79_021552 [Cricetulus griseus]
MRWRESLSLSLSLSLASAWLKGCWGSELRFQQPASDCQFPAPAQGTLFRCLPDPFLQGHRRLWDQQ